MPNTKVVKGAERIKIRKMYCSIEKPVKKNPLIQPPVIGAFPGQCPLRGLMVQTSLKSSRWVELGSFAGHPWHLITAGAHLGRKLTGGAQSGTCALMHSKISGKANAFPLINYRGISTQLLRAHLLIALLLECGARVLLISDNDSQHFPRQIVVGPGKTEGHFQGEGVLIPFRGTRPGICSNWPRLREEVWNLVHYKKFFSQGDVVKKGEFLSSTPLKEKQLLFHGLVSPRRERGLQPQGIGSKSSKINATMAGAPVLYYSKKPDVLLLINSKENLSIAGEAQAQRIPLISLTNTEDSPIKGGEVGISSNGVLQLIANNQSASWMFFFSSLLCQMSSRK